MTTYKLAYDKEIADELRRRFSSDIAFITTEGFTPFSLHQEILFPFSMVLFFPVYLAMRSKEIVQIQFPFQISTFHLLYASQTRATYAYVYGLGCKFYTTFTDGTWLVSNTRQKIRNNAVIVLPSEMEGSALTSEVWRQHQEKISALEAQGKTLSSHLSFETWSGLEQQFDEGSMTSVIGSGLMMIALTIFVLYWLISRLLAIFDIG